MKTLNYTGLKASAVKKVTEELEKYLANYQIFYSNLRGFHWNVQGKQFFTLHARFEDMYNQAAEIVDEVAERLLALGQAPEHRYSQYLKTAELKEEGDLTSGEEIIGRILETYKVLIAQERRIASLAEEAEDLVTADMVTGFLKDKEKTVWMLSAYLAK